MPLTLDLSGDHAVWDNRATVTFRSQTAPGTFASATVTDCLRRAVLAGELAPSAGVYTAGDVRWLVPKATLGATLPKPGDLVVEADATEWTVLAVEFWALRQTWLLGCRDLVLAHGLADTVDFFAPRARTDAWGSRQTDWLPQALGLAARIQEVEGVEVERFGRRGTERRFAVTLARDLELSTDLQLRDRAGRVYEVLSWTNRQRLDELTVIEARLLFQPEAAA